MKKKTPGRFCHDRPLGFAVQLSQSLGGLNNTLPHIHLLTQLPMAFENECLDHHRSPLICRIGLSMTGMALMAEGDPKIQTPKLYMWGTNQ